MGDLDSLRGPGLHERAGHALLARGTPAAAGVEEPPEDASSALAWAEAHHVDDCLDHAAQRVLPWLRSGAASGLLGALSDHRVRHCLDGDLRGRAASAGHAGGDERLRAAARAYLWYCAARRRLDDARRRLWSRRPDHASPRLRALSRLARRTLARMSALPGVDDPVIFVEAPLRVLRDQPSLAVQFRTVKRSEGEGPSVTTRLALDGADPDRLELTCTCAHGDRPGCPHRRVLLEWALDIVHDPADPLHAALADVVSQPGWCRLVDSLRSTQDRGSSEAVERELVWRLGGQGPAVVLQPAIRKRSPIGRWGRGRILPPEQCLDEAAGIAGTVDRQVLASLALAAQRGGRIGDELLAACLEALVGHPRVFCLDQPSRPVAVERVRPVVVLARQAGGDGHCLALRLGGRLVRPAEIAGCRLDERHLVVVDATLGRCAIATLATDAVGLVGAIERTPVALPPESLQPLLDALTPFQPDIELEVPDEILGEELAADCTVALHLEPLPGGGLEASLCVRPAGGAAWAPGEGPERVFGLGSGGRYAARRDLDRERARALALASRLGLGAARPTGPGGGRWVLADRDAALDLLATAQTGGAGVLVEWPDPAAAWQIQSVAASAVAVRLQLAQDRFVVEGGAELSGGRVALEPLLDAARTGSRYVQIGPGRFARIEAQLRDLLRRADEILVPQPRGGVAFGPALAEPAAEIFAGLGPVETDAAWDELRARISEARRLEPAAPADLAVPLRGYQLAGFRWLARLAHREAGCCLADDPGLGKSVQAIALLIHRARLGPALVVAPATVAPRWALDLRRLAPSLRLVPYRGPGRRALLRELGPGDVLVASDRLFADDVELLESRRFASFVVDEAQALEGTAAQRLRRASRVRAAFRLALASAPLLDRPEEVWSVFHVVSPGLLGPWEHFASRFVGPPGRGDEGERRAALERLVGPFLLRRRRVDVLDELPPRTEVVAPVELSAEERHRYDEARRTAIEAGAFGAGAPGRAAPCTPERQGHLLEAVDRLRRLACHPRLIDPDSAVPSSKLAAALELIDQLAGQGQRTLVRSQLAEHLSLLREALDHRRTPHLCLDGTTSPRGRARAVEQWQLGEVGLLLLGPDADVAGLRLAAADCELHIDPPWSPESGDPTPAWPRRPEPGRPLTVISLVAQGTIEEALLVLPSRKRTPSPGLWSPAGREPLSALELDDLIRWDDDNRAVSEGDSGMDMGTSTSTSTSMKHPARAVGAADGAVAIPTPPVTPPLPLLAPDDLSCAVERFLESLEDERRRGLIRTDATLSLYRRSAGRLVRFVRGHAVGGGEELRTLEDWGARYLEALRAGTFEAPHGESSVARTVLRRLARF